ncbi:unnamed protein product [Owenia fusiformis]|uniref:NadR/Ttd14 AAA domain-containing protein n=1 Tax=Owenia fusiformis TaxID=6347 RepID=A0A8S4PW22_OWEFU|nr:unnamed protein product [Owenia fusiformis]
MVLSFRNIHNVYKVTRGLRGYKMSQSIGTNNNKVYRLVLTGGPCGGKTTGQSRICSFFESIGWKVYRVPETATVLLSGGIKFPELSAEDAYNFQENLLNTMLRIEDTYFDLASTCKRNCLVICDRGVMDATAYLPPESWEKMRNKNDWNNVELRDNRYNQVIHLVSAAKGAEEFYSCESNQQRSEGLDLARHLDDKASQAWVGHPYYDVIDNTTDFEGKCVRTVAAVCNRLGIDAGDRLSLDAKKRKFLVAKLPPDLLDVCITSDQPAEGSNKLKTTNSEVYPQFQDFIVLHDYLVTPNSKMQARVRRRGQNVEWDVERGVWKLETGNWTYTHTLRKPRVDHQKVETKMNISKREYQLLLAQRDLKHFTIYKKRRCFLWNNQYFQMDIYQDPCHPRAKGIIILETYTTLHDDKLKLPDFLDITREITVDTQYSMFNLSLKEDWTGSKKLLQSLSKDEDSKDEALETS